MRLAHRSGVVWLAVCVLAGAAAAQPADPLTRGHDHYFNLEYPEAIRAYYDALESQGESPKIWNHIATAILYQELHRLGRLETSAFRGDNTFLDEDKPQPDPEQNERFRGALGYARKLAEQRLQKDPRDRAALFSLSQNHGLEANYLFMIDKSYLAALRAGNRARKHSNELRELYPDFVDAYLVAGVQEYVVGSLPWAVRALIAIGGVRGNKQKGQEWVSRVASEGESMRTEAQVLMTLLHRREKRPLQAARLLSELIGRFPRNYVLHLEQGAMLLDAGERDDALRVFQNALGKVENDEDRFGRMPERLRKALQRKVEELNEAEDEPRVVRRAALGT